MVWIVVTTLLLFYMIGRVTFHAQGPVRILPFVAVVVLLTDFLITRRYRTNR